MHPENHVFRKGDGFMKKVAKVVLAVVALSVLGLGFADPEGYGDGGGDRAMPLWMMIEQGLL